MFHFAQLNPFCVMKTDFFFFLERLFQLLIEPKRNQHRNYSKYKRKASLLNMSFWFTIAYFQRPCPFPHLLLRCSYLLLSAQKDSLDISHWTYLVSLIPNLICHEDQEKILFCASHCRQSYGDWNSHRFQVTLACQWMTYIL